MGENSLSDDVVDDELVIGVFFAAAGSEGSCVMIPASNAVPRRPSGGDSDSTAPTPGTSFPSSPAEDGGPCTSTSLLAPKPCFPTANGYLCFCK